MKLYFFSHFISRQKLLRGKSNFKKIYRSSSHFHTQIFIADLPCHRNDGKDSCAFSDQPHSVNRITDILALYSSVISRLYEIPPCPALQTEHMRRAHVTRISAFPRSRFASPRSPRILLSFKADYETR